jgi:hypothetical protein
MVNDTDLAIKSFNQIRMDHPCYIVPAYLETPVCETKSMFILRRELRLRRKTIERARLAQNPGSTFIFGGTKNRALICVMLGASPESLTGEFLRASMSKALHQTIQDTAIIGEGFRMPSNAKNIDDVRYGFELLCRALRRLGFSGTVYEPPEYMLRQDQLSGFSEEQSTDTHTIIRWDGSVSPSLPPTMLKLRKPAS